MSSYPSYCHIIKAQRAYKNLDAFAKTNGLLQALIAKFQSASVNELFNPLLISELV